MNDPFYIGWESETPAAMRKKIRTFVTLVTLSAVLLGVLWAGLQQTIGVSVFEWVTLKKFSGVLKLQPYPHLQVPRPGAQGLAGGFSTYYLVAPFKFGLDREKFLTLEGKPVSLQGTLIYRENQTMIEALPDSIKASDQPSPQFAESERMTLGRQTLVGEIVDSKCFLGVMNPGQLLPHRACAIRCISGGIPPVLLVRQTSGPAIYLLLVDANGKPVNQQVLDKVAEPIQITGDVERQGDLLVIRAEPATYLRVR